MTTPTHSHASHASWLELDARALAANVALFRNLLAPDTRMGAVLKGNAYGHGFAQMLPLVHPLVDAIYVIDPQDALAIRERERKEGWPERQVVVLGAMGGEEAMACGKARVDVTIASGEWAEFVQTLRAAELAEPLRAHVHLDTGLGREGFTPEEVATHTAFLKDARDVITVCGALTHFANTEDVTEQTYAFHQLRTFASSSERLQASLGLPSLERHLAASAAAMLIPETRADIVRLGIALYGLWPSSETRLSARVVFGKQPQLAPVLSWKCESQLVKRIPQGAYVGYGCTWKAPRDSRIAVFPVGYFDGYPRLLSGRGHVLVGGARCPVVGRVMMNHLVVDVSDVVSDERPVVATLLGRDGGEEVCAELLGSWAQTINYEIVTRLGPHLRRVVV